MNKISSFFLIAILSCQILKAEIPADNQPAPDPNYGIMFPTTTEQNEGKLITEDEFKQDDISGTFGYESNMGTTNYKKVTDATGRTYIIDTTTGLEVDLKEKEVSSTYTTKLNSLGTPDDPSLSTLEQSKARLSKAREVKKERNKELESNSYSPKQMENQFVHKTEAYGSGTTVVNTTILNPKQLEGTEDTQAAYNYYQNGFGYTTNNLKSESAVTQNAGKLKEAYKMFAEFEALQKSKMSASSIKCYISRELIPQYYCPMNGRQDTKFGGDNLTTEAEAKQACNKNCQEPRQCVGSKVLTTKNIDLGMTTFTLFPYSETNKVIESAPLKRSMMIDYLSFEIEVKPSSEFKGTAQEFETFLTTTGLKFRYSLIKKDTEVNNPNQLLLDKELKVINSSLSKITIPINETAGNISILFYKPFINELLNSYDNIVNGDKYKQIASVTIKNIEAKYKSDKLFYCPLKQFVDQTNQCTGLDAQIKTITNESQTYKLCIDSNHRIGPESETGGFFTEDSCEQSCIEAMDCEPTYETYTSITQANFRANVGCITSEDNTGCTEEKCKNLLGNEELRPTNEWVLQNDDSKVQTVANKVINTSVTRPRFDLTSELALSESSNPDYNIIFQSEMKDTAFKNMFTNATYNTISYKIGEESPRKMSYYTELVSGKMNLLLNIKPESFKIDNNKTYNLYVVMELDQLYKPIAGTFIVDGENIQANRPEYNDLQFQDKTYLIRTADPVNLWKVFKKIEFTNKKTVYDVKSCEDGTLEWQKKGYFENKIIPSTCYIYQKVLWPETQQLNINRDVFYLPASDIFATYDNKTEKAAIFNSQKFSSNTVENSYLISDYVQLDIENAAGGLIRDQVSQNYDLDFRKIYAGNYMGDLKRGWPYNYKLYAFYSDEQLTYEKILEKLTAENVFYEKINPDKYPKKIKHDGDINNNIKSFILGSPEKSTVNVEIMPYLQEEGQRVFKFMFLYDEANTSTGFENYKIKGN